MNPARACKAEREEMGDEEFAGEYGVNENRGNAFGKCVSREAREQGEVDSGGEGRCPGTDGRRSLCFEDIGARPGPRVRPRGRRVDEGAALTRDNECATGTAAGGDPPEARVHAKESPSATAAEGDGFIP